MTSVTLSQAWTAWFRNDLAPNALLWGLQIIWWARIGKLMQFFGALTVLVEIIGADRLRTFGASLHEQVKVSSIRQIWSAAFQHIRDSLASALMGNREARDRFYRSPLSNVTIWLCLPVAGIVTSILLPWLRGAPWRLPVAFIPILVTTFVFVLPVFYALVASLMAVIVIALDVVLIEPAAWLIEHPALDKATKIGATVLLSLGFHFDLLGS